ncbi:MAG: hypothetical protein KJ818_07145, partial [Candidatus Omnitrophica bacterium]|nr:hypothetical protein [Candidatus Omnitrophota bacterium]
GQGQSLNNEQGQSPKLASELTSGTVPALRKHDIEQTTKTLLNYFLIGISLPDSSFWVNLRPDSPDSIIDDSLARTDLGRILLEADLNLKKDTALATSPETPQGKEYWDKLYTKAEELFGSGSNITIPTLTRPWIVPSEIIIRETPTNAYIYKATLKVMLESDYLRDSPSALTTNNNGALGQSLYDFKDPRLKELNEYSTTLIKELIIPKLTQSINTSKKYAPLRQVYYSLILAQWFKKQYQGQSPLGTAPLARPDIAMGGTVPTLINSSNLSGLTSTQPWSKDTYFKAYQKSFKDGEYNYKQNTQTYSGTTIRSYFSGGVELIAGMPQATTVVTGNPSRTLTETTNRNLAGVDVSGENLQVTGVSLPQEQEAAKEVEPEVEGQSPQTTSTQETGTVPVKRAKPLSAKEKFSQRGAVDFSFIGEIVRDFNAGLRSLLGKSEKKDKAPVLAKTRKNTSISWMARMRKAVLGALIFLQLSASSLGGFVVNPDKSTEQAGSDVIHKVVIEAEKTPSPSHLDALEKNIQELVDDIIAEYEIKTKIGDQRIPLMRLRDRSGTYLNPERVDGVHLANYLWSFLAATKAQGIDVSEFKLAQARSILRTLYRQTNDESIRMNLALDFFSRLYALNYGPRIAKSAKDIAREKSEQVDILWDNALDLVTVLARNELEKDGFMHAVKQELDIAKQEIKRLKSLGNQADTSWSPAKNQGVANLYLWFGIYDYFREVLPVSGLEPGESAKTLAEALNDFASDKDLNTAQEALGRLKALADNGDQMAIYFYLRHKFGKGRFALQYIVFRYHTNIITLYLDLINRYEEHDEGFNDVLRQMRAELASPEGMKQLEKAAAGSWEAARAVASERLGGNVATAEKMNYWQHKAQSLNLDGDCLVELYAVIALMNDDAQLAKAARQCQEEYLKANNITPSKLFIYQVVQRIFCDADKSLQQETYQALVANYGLEMDAQTWEEFIYSQMPGARDNELIRRAMDSKDRLSPNSRGLRLEHTLASANGVVLDWGTSPEAWRAMRALLQLRKYGDHKGYASRELNDFLKRTRVSNWRLFFFANGKIGNLLELRLAAAEVIGNSAYLQRVKTEMLALKNPWIFLMKIFTALSAVTAGIVWARVIRQWVRSRTHVNLPSAGTSPSGASSAPITLEPLAKFTVNRGGIAEEFNIQDALLSIQRKKKSNEHDRINLKTSSGEPVYTGDDVKELAEFNVDSLEFVAFDVVRERLQNKLTSAQLSFKERQLANRVLLFLRQLQYAGHIFTTKDCPNYIWGFSCGPSIVVFDRLLGDDVVMFRLAMEAYFSVFPEEKAKVGPDSLLDKVFPTHEIPASNEAIKNCKRDIEEERISSSETASFKVEALRSAFGNIELKDASSAIHQLFSGDERTLYQSNFNDFVTYFTNRIIQERGQEAIDKTIILIKMILLMQADVDRQKKDRLYAGLKDVFHQAPEVVSEEGIGILVTIACYKETGDTEKKAVIESLAILAKGGTGEEMAIRGLVDILKSGGNLEAGEALLDIARTIRRFHLICSDLMHSLNTASLPRGVYHQAASILAELARWASGRSINQGIDIDITALTHLESSILNSFDEGVEATSAQEMLFALSSLIFDHNLRQTTGTEEAGEVYVKILERYLCQEWLHLETYDEAVKCLNHLLENHPVASVREQAKHAFATALEKGALKAVPLVVEKAHISTQESINYFIHVFRSSPPFASPRPEVTLYHWSQAAKGLVKIALSDSDLPSARQAVQTLADFLTSYNNNGRGVEATPLELAADSLAEIALKTTDAECREMALSSLGASLPGEFIMQCQALARIAKESQDLSLAERALEILERKTGEIQSANLDQSHYQVILELALDLGTSRFAPKIFSIWQTCLSLMDYNAQTQPDIEACLQYLSNAVLNEPSLRGAALEVLGNIALKSNDVISVAAVGKIGAIAVSCGGKQAKAKELQLSRQAIEVLAQVLAIGKGQTLWMEAGNRLAFDIAKKDTHPAIAKQAIEVLGKTLLHSVDATLSLVVVERLGIIVLENENLDRRNQALVALAAPLFSDNPHPATILMVARQLRAISATGPSFDQGPRVQGWHDFLESIVRLLAQGLRNQRLSQEAFACILTQLSEITNDKPELLGPEVAESAETFLRNNPYKKDWYEVYCALAGLLQQLAEVSPEKTPLIQKSTLKAMLDALALHPAQEQFVWSFHIAANPDRAVPKDTTIEKFLPAAQAIIKKLGQEAWDVEIITKLKEIIINWNVHEQSRIEAVRLLALVVLSRPELIDISVLKAIKATVDSSLGTFACSGLKTELFNCLSVLSQKRPDLMRQDSFVEDIAKRLAVDSGALSFDSLPAVSGFLNTAVEYNAFPANINGPVLVNALAKFLEPGHSVEEAGLAAEALAKLLEARPEFFSGELKVKDIMVDLTECLSSLYYSDDTLHHFLSMGSCLEKFSLKFPHLVTRETVSALTDLLLLPDAGLLTLINSNKVPEAYPARIYASRLLLKGLTILGEITKLRPELGSSILECLVALRRTAGGSRTAGSASRWGNPLWQGDQFTPVRWFMSMVNLAKAGEDSSLARDVIMDLDSILRGEWQDKDPSYANASEALKMIAIARKDLAPLIVGLLLTALQQTGITQEKKTALFEAVLPQLGIIITTVDFEALVYESVSASLKTELATSGQSQECYEHILGAMAEVSKVHPAMVLFAPLLKDGPHKEKNIKTLSVFACVAGGWLTANEQGVAQLLTQINQHSVAPDSSHDSLRELVEKVSGDYNAPQLLDIELLTMMQFNYGILLLLAEAVHRAKAAHPAITAILEPDLLKSLCRRSAWLSDCLAVLEGMIINTPQVPVSLIKAVINTPGHNILDALHALRNQPAADEQFYRVLEEGLGVLGQAGIKGAAVAYFIASQRTARPVNCPGLFYRYQHPFKGLGIHDFVSDAIQAVCVDFPAFLFYQSRLLWLRLRFRAPRGFSPLQLAHHWTKKRSSLPDNPAFFLLPETARAQVTKACAAHKGLTTEDLFKQVNEENHQQEPYSIYTWLSLRKGFAEETVGVNYSQFKEMLGLIARQEPEQAGGALGEQRALIEEFIHCFVSGQESRLTPEQQTEMIALSIFLHRKMLKLFRSKEYPAGKAPVITFRELFNFNVVFASAYMQILAEGEQSGHKKGLGDILPIFIVAAHDIYGRILFEDNLA